MEIKRTTSVLPLSETRAAARGKLEDTSIRAAKKTIKYTDAPDVENDGSDQQAAIARVAMATRIRNVGGKQWNNDHSIFDVFADAERKGEKNQDIPSPMRSKRRTLQDRQKAGDEAKD